VLAVVVTWTTRVVGVAVAVAAPAPFRNVLFTSKPVAVTAVT
jgi:hypothetical protein